jgi:RNA recognition motif-containing protein
MRPPCRPADTGPTLDASYPSSSPGRIAAQRFGQLEPRDADDADPAASTRSAAPETGWRRAHHIGKQTVNIYVGNLSYSVTEGQLRALFEEYGQIESLSLITDKFSGQSKGFGFVEMSKQQEGEAAIKGLNGRDLDGRKLTVNIAKPRNERAPSRPRSW